MREAQKYIDTFNQDQIGFIFTALNPITRNLCNQLIKEWLKAQIMIIAELNNSPDSLIYIHVDVYFKGLRILTLLNTLVFYMNSFTLIS